MCRFPRTKKKWKYETKYEKYETEKFDDDSWCPRSFVAFRNRHTTDRFHLFNKDLAAARKSPWGVWKIVRNRKTLVSLHSLFARSVARFASQITIRIVSHQGITASYSEFSQPREKSRMTHILAHARALRRERERERMNTDFDNQSRDRGGSWRFSLLTHSSSSIGLVRIEIHVGITALLVHCATVSSAPYHTVAIAVITASLGMQQRDPEDRRCSRSVAFDTRDEGLHEKGSSGKREKRRRKVADREEKEERRIDEKGVLRRERKSAHDCSLMQPTARLVAAASPHLCTSTHAISILHRLSSHLTSLLATLLYSRASGTQCGVGAGRCCAGIRDSARLG